MPPPWNEMLPSSVIPSFCHSVSIYFPIIIWTTIAHIQLEINIWMYLINIRATNEFSFDSMIFDEVMPLKIWKKWESTFKRFLKKKPLLIFNAIYHMNLSYRFTGWVGIWYRSILNLVQVRLFLTELCLLFKKKSYINGFIAYSEIKQMS